MRNHAFRFGCLLAIILVAVLARTSSAGSHLWVISEVFSNADGTVQFVEMEECCGAPDETRLTNKWILSDSTTNQYDFTEDLVGNTAKKFLLLATPAFAALPNAPTPDYIITENFFDIQGDTITYWFYPNAVMTFGSGEVPLDGVQSLYRDGITGTNSPTNFAGESGSIDLSVGAAPTSSAWSLIAIVVLLMLCGSIVIARGRR